jgi:formylmethanofuran dehydrogenase subunit C
MTGLTLTLRQPSRQRLDLSPLLPERLAGLDEAAIAKIALVSGNRRIPVGELFTLSGEDPADLRIGNPGPTALDFIGKDMTGGRITVEGDAGAYVGLGLKGGRIHVRGHVGPWAGADMRRGVIEIDGDAGDFPGGALPGEMRGMSGGLLIVRGNAGDRAGDRMRRGLLVVEGNIGAYAGSRMIAGTIAALGGTVGPYPGFGMRRGSLILTGSPSQMLPTFADCGRHELGFLRLLPQALDGCSSRLADFAARPPQMQRLAGDRAAGGKGEILIGKP